MNKRTYCVFNRDRESFLGVETQVADTPAARLKGLIGQRKPRTGEGVWIVPSWGIHSFGLLSPIDLVYLDAGNRVIHLVEHFRPFRIGPLRIRGASVLELAPHTIYASETQVGDRLIIGSPGELERYFREKRAMGMEISPAER